MSHPDLDLYNKIHLDDVVTDDSEFNQLYKLYELVEPDTKEINVDKAWNKIENSITPTKLLWQSTWLRVAAVIAVVLSGVIIYSVIQGPNLVEYTAENTNQEFLLPDGSSVWLTKGSSITYANDFIKRNINLKGEGYFEVKKDNRAFTVSSENVRVKVLGTAFSVKGNGSKTTVSVEHGKVLVSLDDQKAELTKGQQIVAYSDESKLEVSKPDKNVFSWKSGEFDFENTPLELALKNLQKHYGTDIILNNKAMGKCKVSGKFNQKELPEILEILSVALNFEISTRDNQIVLVGEGC